MTLSGPQPLLIRRQSIHVGPAAGSGAGPTYLVESFKYFNAAS